jgi:hypothetical protein
MDKHPTEHVYDEEMFPLVAQLIAIANRNKIPLIVSAGMIFPGPDGEPGSGCCTTVILHGKGERDERLRGAENRFGLCEGIIRGHSGFDNAAGLIISRFHEAAE